MFDDNSKLPRSTKPESNDGLKALIAVISILFVIGLMLGSLVAGIMLPIKGVCWLLGGC